MEMVVDIMRQQRIIHYFISQQSTKAHSKTLPMQLALELEKQLIHLIFLSIQYALRNAHLRF